MPALLMLAAAALAIPPPLERPGWYDCTAQRRDPAGTVFVTQSIPPEGAAGPRRTLWRPATGDEAVNLWADWEGPAPVRMESGRVHVLLFTTPARVEMRRIGRRGGRERRFAGLFPLPDRIAGAGIGWAPFLAMARGVPALEIAAVDADGHAIRSVRLRARHLERVAHLVAAIQPEFDAIVADHRNRCVVRGPRPTG